MKTGILAAALIALAVNACAQNASPSDARDLLARGAALVQTKPAEAVKLLQQAVRLDPELPDVQFQLGLAYHGIGDEADAEAELREAVGRKPDSAPARNYLGIALFGLGNAKAALEEFRVAAKLAPKDPKDIRKIKNRIVGMISIRASEVLKGTTFLKYKAPLKAIL